MNVHINDTVDKETAAHAKQSDFISFWMRSFFTDFLLFSLGISFVFRTSLFIKHKHKIYLLCFFLFFSLVLFPNVIFFAHT